MVRSVGITGHRPPKIGGFNPNHPIRQWIKQCLTRKVEEILAQNPDTVFNTGMALGVDQVFAEIVLDRAGIVHAYIPGKWQARRWPAASQKHYQNLLTRISEKGQLLYPESEQEYSPGLLMERNSRLVEASTEAIAVWDGSKGGTADAVAKFWNKGVPIFWINPQTQEEKILSDFVCINKTS